MPDKKENEHRVMQMFVSLLDHFPKGKLIRYESPDFLLRLNKRKLIGIELTELRGQFFFEQLGYFVQPDLLFRNIENTIAAKEEKVYLYLKIKPNELWLLIHLYSFRDQLNFNYRNKLSNMGFHSSFNRVFILEEKSKWLCELIPH